MIDLTKLYTLRNDIHDAIENEDINKLNKLFKTSTTFINLNYIDSKDGQTPLHKSCIIGNLDILKLLIENGANLNITNKNGWYPIHLASYFGNTQIVLYLLQLNTNDSDNNSSTEDFTSDEDSNLSSS